MAITIINEPTSPNASNTRLVYSISSTNTSQPQFQYITDIYSGSTQLTRLYSYANPAGSGIIDIGRILDDNLEYDNDWKTSTSVAADDSFREFTIEFGESYGTSVSSSVSIFPDLTTTTIDVFPGTIDPNQGSFNFINSGSYQLLSNQTQGYIAKGNYLTIPVYIPPSAVVGSKDLIVQFFDAAGSILAQSTLSLTPGASYQIKQQAIGSGSAVFGNNFENDDWTTIKVLELNSAELLTTFNRVEQCRGEGITFAFVNNYGYYDYYSSGNPVRKQTNLTRDTFKSPNVDYSSANSVYNITRRGEKQYNIGYDDRYVITTDYLDEATATWLTELFDSPEVYVQENGNFIPINITNANYTWNTNQSRQKTFQYNIEFKYANNRYDR
jgi:hypothetical protein